jgi:hypothetical protein
MYYKTSQHLPPIPHPQKCECLLLLVTYTKTWTNTSEVYQQCGTVDTFHYNLFLTTLITSFITVITMDACYVHNIIKMKSANLCGYIHQVILGKKDSF